MADQNALKRQAAERAVEYIGSGTAIGLGSGSTMRYVLEAIGQQIRDGRLREIVGVPTSQETARLATEQGIPLATPNEQPLLALALDGADEIDGKLNLIKGLGGALLREKIVASSAAQFIVVADSSKLVPQLGTRGPVPIEVLPFGRAPAARRLAALGGEPRLRQQADGTPFLTDQDNVVFDYFCGPINDPEALDRALRAIPGVMEHGLFLGMAALAVVAADTGVQIITRPG